MSTDHAPPETYRFNKLRESSGSHRVTLVKAAVEAADVNPGPPRPVFANLPVGEGAWVAFDVSRYDSQVQRVRARRAATAELAPGTSVVGEFPVSIRGKLGSVVVLVPKQLVEALDLETAEQVTTVAIAPSAFLFLTASRVDAADGEIATAIEAAREAIDGG